MPLNGQASGGWTESSSALRILYVGHRNSVGVLTDDAFTQTNPSVVATSGTVSTNVDTQAFGVLSGSVAFTRPDAGENFVGGPIEGLPAVQAAFVRPLGLFINSANGNAFENLPGQASGKGPYTSSQGTYGSSVFETFVLAGASVGGPITYVNGMDLIASRNGFLMPRTAIVAGAAVSLDDANNASEMANAAAAASTLVGVLKMAPDATMNELVFDQRI